MRPLAARAPYREAALLAPQAPRALHESARYLLFGGEGRGLLREPWIRLGLVSAAVALALLVPLVLRPGGIWTTFIVLSAVFTALRAAPIIREILRRRRRLRAYRIGAAARGRVVGGIEKIATGDTETGRSYWLRWEVYIDGGTYEGSLDHVDRRALEGAIDDGERVTVLYDPANPKVNTLWIEEGAAVLSPAGGDALEGPRKITRTARRFLLGTSNILLLFGIPFTALGLIVFVAFAASALASGEFSFWLLHPLVFLAVGVGMLTSGLRARVRTLRAYRRGDVAQGRIIERSESGFRVNGAPMFRIRWAFEVDGVTYEGTLMHRDGASVAATLPDDEVSVLYDPVDPRTNTLWIK